MNQSHPLANTASNLEDSGQRMALAVALTDLIQNLRAASDAALPDITGASSVAELDAALGRLADAAAKAADTAGTIRAALSGREAS